MIGSDSHTRRRDTLRSALQILAPGQRELLIARFGGATVGELARSTNQPPEIAVQAMDRAIARLRARGLNEGIDFIVLKMPSDSGQLICWLERQLSGTHLDALVAELSVVHEVAAGQRVSLRLLLRSGRLAAVLERGLAELSSRRVSALLMHPDLLVQLRRLVLADGGRYWKQIVSADRAAA